MKVSLAFSTELRDRSWNYLHTDQVIYLVAVSLDCITYGHNGSAHKSYCFVQHSTAP